MYDVLEDDNQAHQAESGNARDLGLITEGCDSSHRMLPIYLGSVCSVDIGLAWRTSFGRADRSTDRGTAAPDTLPSVPTMCYPIPETKGLTSWRQRAKTGRNGRFEAQIDSTERAQSSQPEGRGFESHFPLQNTYTLRKAGHFAQPFSPQSGDHLLSRQRVAGSSLVSRSKK